MGKVSRSKDINHSLGNALAHHQAGRLREAQSLYKKILRVDPDHADALHLLGMSCFQSGKNELAIKHINKAIDVNPSSPIYYNNLGEVYRSMQRYGQAVDCYRKALSLKPDFAEACNNMGSASKSQGLYEQAVAWYRKALSFKPAYPDACYNLGNALQEQGEQSGALAAYRSALSMRPDFSKARWALAMTQIPVFCEADDDPASCRAAFRQALDDLEDWFDADRIEQGYSSVGNQHPFYLAYQEINNRDLLSRCGALYSRLMENWKARQGYTLPARTTGETIRLGIVSAHIRNHSVWNALVKGWFQHLDRKRFELYTFHIGSRQDEETSWAQSQSAFFVQGINGLQQWAEIILGKQVDVLIYPEVSMDTTTTKLASLRLAPVQVASWGHAETTGLPTMDYYLSAKGLEPPNAQDNYSEQLVLLPHLGCCYHPLTVDLIVPDFSELGIDPESPILVCPGAPFKYAPQHDRVFVEIARRLGKCQFIFFTHHFHNLSDKLHERLTSVFTEAELNIDDHVIFIPWLERSAFYGLMTRADIFLDTIGFSGFNTAIQAVECGLPVVSREGKFLRGRLASGILQRIGLSELIVSSEHDYVELTVRLAQDHRYRESIRQRIKASRHTLFGDLAPVRALEGFLVNAVKKR